MIRDFFAWLYTEILRWILSFVPFPTALEEKAIAATFDYIDSLILAQNPQAWALADAYLLEQLENLGGFANRHLQLMKIIRRRFDPIVLIEKFVAAE